MSSKENRTYRKARGSRALSTCAAALLASVTISMAAETAVRDFTDFQLITRRNIFDPNRQAPRPPGERPPRRPPVDSFTFTGTMSYSKGWFAFFGGTSAEYEKVAEQGETIAGYTIQEIGHDMVRLAQGDTNEVQLTVGMQMRRFEDGSWRPAEAASLSTTAVAATSRWSTERFDRGRESNFNNGRGRNNNNGRTRGREDWRGGNFGGQWNQGAMANVLQNMQAAPMAVPNDGNTDGMDIATRMRLRRMQEMGGLPAQEGADALEALPAGGAQRQQIFLEGGPGENAEVNGQDRFAPEQGVEQQGQVEPEQQQRFRQPVGGFGIGPGPNEGGAGVESGFNGNDNTNASDED